MSRKGETMTRQPNRTLQDESFHPRTILAVWNKATIVSNHYCDLRKDRCGAWIRFADYDNVNSDFGWEIDHKKPVVRGGTDDSDNLQPLHWRNNRGKGDNWPNWTCSYRQDS
ncbi:HNH endonuclease signature motif containing protein [Desulfoscipio gibsoniae]